MIESEREKPELSRPDPEIKPEKEEKPAQRTRSVKQMQALLDKNGPLCIPMMAPGAKKGKFQFSLRNILGSFRILMTFFISAVIKLFYTSPPTHFMR